MDKHGGETVVAKPPTSGNGNMMSGRPLPSLPPLPVEFPSRSQTRKSSSSSVMLASPTKLGVLEEHRAPRKSLRLVAFASVAFATISVLACVIIVPLVMYNLINTYIYFSIHIITKYYQRLHQQHSEKCFLICRCTATFRRFNHLCKTKLIFARLGQFYINNFRFE